MVITVLLETWLVEEFHTMELQTSSLCVLMQAAVILHLLFRKYRYAIFGYFYFLNGT